MIFYLTFFLMCVYLLKSLVLSGVYSSFPYILMASLVLSGGFLADWMRKKIPTTIVRKIFTLVRKL